MPFRMKRDVSNAVFSCPNQMQSLSGDYEQDFQREMALIRRHLEDQGKDGDVDNGNVVAWNMCQRVHKYGMWCNANSQALDTFRIDKWIRSNIFLLVIMCVLAG